jgi:hypothetical protein
MFQNMGYLLYLEDKSEEKFDVQLFFIPVHQLCALRA